MALWKCATIINLYYKRRHHKTTADRTGASRHQDKEGILDRYTYLYDLLGNKTGITKERRGLTEESGS